MYENEVKEFIESAKKATNHSQKQILLLRFLCKVFDLNEDDLIFNIEKEIKTKLKIKEDEFICMRGRSDLLYYDIVFEVKMNLKREIEKAKEEIKKYLNILYYKDKDKFKYFPFIAIATDLIEWKIFLPEIKNDEVTNLRELYSFDVLTLSPDEFILRLDSIIFSRPKIPPTAKDLKIRFGIGSPTFLISIEKLKQLWEKVKNEEDVRLKFHLWLKNMEIVYGSKPSEENFILHTYLITLVKLIVAHRIYEKEFYEEEEFREILSGSLFSKYGIENLIEEDFFSWILHKKIVDEVIKLVKNLGEELLKYDLTQIDEDFFKEIYEEIVEKGQRHRIGEYYTPEWLAQLILEEVFKIWKENNKKIPSILDPACGSGTFLCNAIHLLKDILSKQINSEEKKEEILSIILSNVVGIDINPLAVTIARANYILALGDLLRFRKKNLVIPIYVADSIKLPKSENRIGNGGYINTYTYSLDDVASFQLPSRIAKSREKLNKVLIAMRSAVESYRTEKDEKSSINLFEKELERLDIRDLDIEEKKIIKKTLQNIFHLVREGKDSIWIYVLSNIFMPTILSQIKFDIIVGNPPWIALRYIENKDYQEFVKKMVIDYKLLEPDQIHLFSNIEVASLFFCRTSDLYLKDGGIIGFVMPRSVLTGAHQHQKFKRFEKPLIQLKKILDLENVSPLFNVPSCVLIAMKGAPTTYPVPSVVVSGKLPEKNLKLEEALKFLSFSQTEYQPPQTPFTKSPYFDKIKSGASIIPRNFWFIDFVSHPTLGIDIEKPLCRSSEEIIKKTKDRWKNIVLERKVEKEFIYATILGEDLLPFGYYKLRPIVLPVVMLETSFKVLNISALKNMGYVFMAEWLENAQNWWEKIAPLSSKQHMPRIIDRIDYMGTLSDQNPKKSYAVLYNASGSYIVSCVINKNSLQPFYVGKQPIHPKGFVIESKTLYYETDDEKEAHYLCAILNSEIVDKSIKPYQTRGLFGPRDIGRRPFELPIPKYDPTNEIHNKLANISKSCHEKVSKLKIEEKSTANRRKKVKQHIRNELEEINELVAQILNL